MKAEISIIVPVWNQEKLIGRCIRSLLAQTINKNLFDIIVINDGSTDQTDFSLQLFEDEIKIIRNDKNIGLPASLNKALKEIKTPYFIRVDSDDYVSKDFIYFLYNFALQNPYMDAIACDYNIVNDNQEVLDRKNCLKDPIACGILFRTDQIVDIGLYDENFLLHEDQDLRIRFLQKYHIHRLELPLYRYRHHDKNMTKDKKLMEHYKNLLLKKHLI